MKKNCIGKVLIVVSITLPILNKAYSDTDNKIKLTREISVVADRALKEPSYKTVSQYTPPAPYNTMTFTITAPVKVCVGQTFTIDYAIHVSKFTHISYWSDLIPDSSQGLPVNLIDVQHPTMGIFNSDEASLAQKGGAGLWLFPKGLPGETVQNLKIKVQATAAGLLKFTTVVATNPPSYIGTHGTLVLCNPPIASSIQVTGLSGQPLDFSILDHIVGDSELKVASVSSGSYGNVQLNEDYTVTYTPNRSFYGNDSFDYSVTDAAGNVITGAVSIVIKQSPTPQIIK